MLRRVDRADTSATDDRNALTERLNFREIVRRKQNRHRRVLLRERTDHFTHTRRRKRIERTRRLIKQKHRRVRQHRARHRQSLFVSRRHLTKPPPRHFFQLEFRKQFSNTLFRCAITEAMKTREKHQVLFARESPVKTTLFGCGETDLPSHLFVMQHAVVASDGDAAGGWLDQRRDDLRERCFAGAVATDQTEDLARANVKRNFAQCFHRLFHGPAKERTQPAKRYRISL